MISLILIASMMWGGTTVDIPNPLDDAARAYTTAVHQLAHANQGQTTAEAHFPDTPTAQELAAMPSERLYEQLMIAANRNDHNNDAGTPTAVKQFNHMVDLYNKSDNTNEDFPNKVLHVGNGTSWSAVHEYLSDAGPFEA